MLKIGHLDRIVTDKKLHSDGDNILHYTAKLNRPKILQVLVKIPGIDVNAQNWAGRTPLMVACVSKDYESCKVLVNTPEIDLDRINNFGHTAL